MVSPEPGESSRRVDLVVEGATGAIKDRKDLDDRHLIDRITGTGIAAHKGQLFGWPNQLLGLITAAGLVLLAVSSVCMWWRRREPGGFSVPHPPVDRAFRLGSSSWSCCSASTCPCSARPLSQFCSSNGPFFAGSPGFVIGLDFNLRWRHRPCRRSRPERREIGGDQGIGRESSLIVPRLRMPSGIGEDYAPGILAECLHESVPPQYHQHKSSTRE